MKQNKIELPQKYLAALEKHIKQGPQASLRPALALVMLGLSATKNAFTRLAGIFFAEANTLVEETHRAARETREDLGKLMATLGQRTEELAVSNRQLQQGVARRKVMEEDFAERGRHHQKSLEESLELQKRLRHLTHRVIAAQGDERKKISRELQDEIAQTLLGINVRLLSLKQEARSNFKGLKRELASTQLLVARSARSVRRVGRKIGGL